MDTTTQKALFGNIDKLLVRQAVNKERISVLGVTVEVLVSSQYTDGAWSLIEYTAPPHFRGPAPHWHSQLTETFYVVSGKMLFRLGEQEQVLQAGELAVVPPRLVHSYANPHDEPAKVLVLVSPGGFEGYFREISDLVKQEPVWPPADMSKVVALGEEYDTFSPSALK
jgi:mannose-6-phosphate isomerase-like protein (cupin superfamily)